MAARSLNTCLVRVTPQVRITGPAAMRPERLLASCGLAVTPQTAGFHAVDTASLTDLSLFITIILRFAGAFPAGTGGGVKTSTLAFLVLSVRASLRNREEVEVCYRTIPRETVHKALVMITSAKGSSWSIVKASLWHRCRGPRLLWSASVRCGRPLSEGDPA
jgi:Cation transport protein